MASPQLILPQRLRLRRRLQPAPSARPQPVPVWGWAVPDSHGCVPTAGGFQGARSLLHNRQPRRVTDLAMDQPFSTVVPAHTKSAPRPPTAHAAVLAALRVPALTMQPNSLFLAPHLFLWLTNTAEGAGCPPVPPHPRPIWL